MSTPFATQLERLETRHGFLRLTADEVDAFAAAGDSLLLLTDEPQTCPEAWDMALVLPEALKAWPGRFRVGVADPAASREIAARFGASQLPAMLFQRDGAWVGKLEGMFEWDRLVAALGAMLAAPTARRPGIGIPVRAATTSSCH